MKKIKITILCLIILIGVIILTGCSNKNDRQTIKTITQDLSSNKKTEDELKKNIILDNLGIDSRGDLIIKITNNNDEDITLAYISARIFDSDNKFIAEENCSDSNFYIYGKSTTISYIDNYLEDYEEYSNIQLDVEFDKYAEYSSAKYYRDFEFMANKTNKSIAITTMNKYDNEIEYLQVNGIFYKNGKVVGHSFSNDTNIKPNETSYMNMDFPTDSKYKEVDFDTFEIYLLQAITY